MGLLSKEALNADTDDASDWEGTDVDVWYARWKIKVRHWFAFANRATPGLDLTIVFAPGLFLFPLTGWFTGWSWWYLFPIAIIPVAKKWRLFPKTLFAIRGKGTWRYENKDSTKIIPGNDHVKSWFMPEKFVFNGEEFYLSRIQRWASWHVHLAWPLFLACHFYFDESNVPSPKSEHNTDGQLLNSYLFYHRDEDQIYWGSGGYIGGVWK